MTKPISIVDQLHSPAVIAAAAAAEGIAEGPKRKEVSDEAGGTQEENTEGVSASRQVSGLGVSGLSAAHLQVSGRLTAAAEAPSQPAKDSCEAAPAVTGPAEPSRPGLASPRHSLTSAADDAQTEGSWSRSSEGCLEQ